MASIVSKVNIFLARNAFRNNVTDLVTLNKRLSDLIQSIGGIQHTIAFCGADDVKAEPKSIYFGVTSDLVLQLEKQSFEVVSIRNQMDTLFRLSGYSTTFPPTGFSEEDEPPLWHTAADAPYDREVNHHLPSLNRAFCNVADTLEEINGKLCTFAKWFTGNPARKPETIAEAAAFDEFAVEGMVNSLIATSNTQKQMIENILETLNEVETISYEDEEWRDDEMPTAKSEPLRRREPAAPLPPEPKFGP